jgi:hypothetical protein
VTVTTGELRAASETQLLTWWRAGDEEALREAARRDRLAEQRKARRAEQGEWLDAAHAQYMQAETELNGLLVREDSPVQDAWSLWSGSEAYMLAHASEELRLWFQDHARLTVTAWREALANGRRIQRDERDAEDQPQTAREGTMGALGMAGHVAQDAGRVAGREARYATRLAVRQAQVTQAVQARQGGGRAEVTPREEIPVALRGPQLAPSQMPDAPELLCQVLEEIGLYLMDYVEFPSRGALVAVVLWIAHAAARDAQRDLIWWTSPRLLLTSAENGSGKSTLMDLTGILLQSRVGRMIKVTPYGLTKVLGAFKEVALPDDAQNMFGASGEAAKELQSVLLGSYTRGGSWVSGKNQATIDSAFGPVCLAGKDKLITLYADALADLLARSVIVRMKRPRRYMRQMDREGLARGAALAESLKAVMGALQATLLHVAEDLSMQSVGQEITDGDGGRVNQIWNVLEAVALVADGPWVQAFEQARDELTAASGDLVGAQNVLAGIVGTRTEGRSFWDEASGDDAGYSAAVQDGLAGEGTEDG